MNKKGVEFMATEVVKIVFAVIGISILLLLAYNLYGFATHRNNIEQARATLGEVKGLIDYMDEKGIEKEELILQSPNEWYLIGIGEELCICKKLGLLEEEQKEICSVEGVCEKMRVDFKIVSRIKIEINFVLISKEDDVFVINSSSPEEEENIVPVLA